LKVEPVIYQVGLVPLACLEEDRVPQAPMDAGELNQIWQGRREGFCGAEEYSAKCSASERSSLGRESGGGGEMNGDAPTDNARKQQSRGLC
jgi:hypothetical protein